MGADGVVDITVLGAGPSGLAAAYYAGHRDASVRIVESLEQIGGQVAATYPEKHVYDVAGHPKVQGQALVDLCAEQGLQDGADVRLGEEVRSVETVSHDGEELPAIGTDAGNVFPSRTIERTDTNAVETVPCDALITLLGFVSHLGAIADWGLELEGKRQIRIDPTTCRTSLPRVYAAGDVAGYPGKITLITVGMGEAAIAANNAIAEIRGEKVQPKYSTD